MTDNAVTVIIDGQRISAQPGTTLLQAADAAGVYIPRLCYHPDLPPGGHCRLCTVMIDGRPACACTFPVSDGLVIENDTEELTRMRRTIVEMLFVEGNHCCPACEASGDCELQALGYRLGLIAPTLPYFHPRRELDASHRDVFLDRNRCILCSRCVRASEKVDGKVVFGFEGRGIRTRISVDAEGGLSETDLEASDKAASICPTGCLKLKREGYQVPVGQRTYDKAPIGAKVDEENV